MSVPRIREKRLKKPPACDACKARRVLCHSRPDGGPCPRCVEKDIVCTTTAVPRGRPRKGPPPAPPSVPSAASNLASAKPDPAVPPTSTSLAVYSGLVPGCSSDVLDLHPEFVAHCFDCLQYIPQYNHPLMYTTQIKSTARAVSFQLDRLPPQSRVLSLCIVALSSLISFHEFVLGPGPRPQSFEDHTFFMSEHVLACGARRATAYRTLRGEALRTAWELGIILQPSNENAVSCYLLDILDQSDFYRGPSRPWAAAYISHVRALAPILRTLTPSESDVTYWTGFFMSEAILSTRSRSPMTFTLNDQFLLGGTELYSLEALLASLEAGAQKPGLALVWSSMKPFMFHATCLARQLSETINGDYARMNPLSEGAVVQFLSSLTVLSSVLSPLLDRIDEAISPSANASPFLLDRNNTDSVARGCAYALILGFTSLVLPFYHELEHRAAGPDAPRTRERTALLRAQAHDAAVRASHEFARAIRYLPAVHYTPVHWSTVYAWAEFYVEDMSTAAEPDPARVRDLETMTNELKLMGYSLDFSAPQAAALLARLDGQVATATRAPSPGAFFDLDMFLPLDDAWLSGGGILMAN